MKCIAQPRWITLGRLRAVELPASAGAATIVCMHGYGANAQDLLGIAMELDLDRAARWIFPDAPLEVDLGGGYIGRAWFPINEERIMQAQMTGKALDVSQERPAGFDEAIKAAEGLLAALSEPMSRVILGGFSQGAMMAVELAARAKEKPLGVFILSGTLVDEPNLKKIAPKLTGLRVFQSHGSADPILGFQPAMKLQEALKSAGLDVDFARFEGGHAVPPEIVARLAKYLNAILGGAK